MQLDFSGFHRADLLVHGSNLILLLAYTTRDMLWLRYLALAAAVTIIPYYVIQPEVLWPPIVWSAVYAGVHTYHIAALLRERRPVQMSPDEERLHALSFPSLEPALFLRLLRLGEWEDAPVGTEFDLERESVLLLTEGRVEASRSGAQVGHIQPGELVGVALALEGEPDWVFDLSAATPVRFVRWSRADLEAEMEKSPHIRAACTSLVNHDLARKLLRRSNEA